MGRSILTSIIALLLLCMPASAGMVIGSGAVTGCDIWEQNTAVSTTSSIGRYSNAEYVGTIMTNSTAMTICQVDLYAAGKQGNIDAYNYYCQIWSLTGTTLNAVLGTSTAIAGTAWSTDWVTFTFSVEPTTPEADFAVVFFMDSNANTSDAEYDGTNYALYRFNDEANAWAASNGKQNWKDSDHTQVNLDAEDDIGLKIYTR